MLSILDGIGMGVEWRIYSLWCVDSAGNVLLQYMNSSICIGVNLLDFKVWVGCEWWFSYRWRSLDA